MKIRNTYEGTQTPRMDTTVQKPSRKRPRLSAAQMPSSSPTMDPSSTAMPPMRKEFFTQVDSTVLIGAPLYSEVPLPKSPCRSFQR